MLVLRCFACVNGVLVQLSYIDRPSMDFKQNSISFHLHSVLIRACLWWSTTKRIPTQFNQNYPRVAEDPICSQKSICNGHSRNWHRPWLESPHKSQNELALYLTVQHFVTEMCTHVPISVTRWCIMGYLYQKLLYDCFSKMRGQFPCRKSTLPCNCTSISEYVHYFQMPYMLPIYSKERWT